LNDNRGGYAENNAVRGPWSHIVDLKFIQDFKFGSGKSKQTIQLTADIFNFTNFLNKNWGNIRTAGSFGRVSPLTTVSTGDTPVFSINQGVMDDQGNPDFEQLDDAGLQSSRWQAQIGLRYIFN
jgi:hypothetical protein